MAKVLTLTAPSAHYGISALRMLSESKPPTNQGLLFSEFHLCAFLQQTLKTKECFSVSILAVRLPLSLSIALGLQIWITDA
jgi:hypothetical protein